jgi:hypothetical protein
LNARSSADTVLHAEIAARGLGSLSIADALALVLLYERDGNPKPEIRWTSEVALVTLAVGAGSATADPVQAFDTFTIQCGSDTLVIVSKPGSSNVVTINGVPTNSVSILMGMIVTVNGEVVEEFHKPYTENQDVTICTFDEGPEHGVVEVLNTPPGK